MLAEMVENKENRKKYLKAMYDEMYDEEIVSEEEIYNVIDYIIEIIDRIFDRNGGAKYDYRNFCTYKDFNWLREQIQSELEYLPEELDFEENYGDFDILKDYLKEVQSFIFEIIDEIEEDTSTDNIYDHVINELEYRKIFSEKEVFESLEKELIEKHVVKDIKELKELESYIKAKKYVERQTFMQH